MYKTVYYNDNDKIHTKSGRICTRVDVMLVSISMLKELYIERRSWNQVLIGAQCRTS